jgi:hypothetical protein
MPMNIGTLYVVVSHYIGGYDKEEKAARAYDLAALKYWGPTTTINFPVKNCTIFSLLVIE